MWPQEHFSGLSKRATARQGANKTLTAVSPLAKCIIRNYVTTYPVYQKVITTSIRSMKCSLRQNGNNPSKRQRHNKKNCWYSILQRHPKTEAQGLHQTWLAIWTARVTYVEWIYIISVEEAEGYKTASSHMYSYVCLALIFPHTHVLITTVWLTGSFNMWREIWQC
jgi:hypothetical protein